MLLLAEKAGFKLLRSEYDSEAFQFWASEQYVRKISLHDPVSYASEPKKSIFKPEDIRNFENSARELNQKRDGDQACFVFQASS